MVYRRKREREGGGTKKEVRKGGRGRERGKERTKGRGGREKERKKHVV